MRGRDLGGDDSNLELGSGRWYECQCRITSRITAKSPRAGDRSGRGSGSQQEVRREGAIEGCLGKMSGGLGKFAGSKTNECVFGRLFGSVKRILWRELQRRNYRRA